MTTRICIIGTSCSGKTTLAAEISRRCGIPHIELDALHWKPNWEQRDSDEFCELVRDAASADSWVTDGNYSVVRQALWPRATTIVWLNYPFPLVMYRALTRTVHRVVTRKKLYADNVETFRKSFLSRESILLWVLQTHLKKRKSYPALLEEARARGATIEVMTAPSDAREYLEKLG